MEIYTYTSVENENGVLRIKADHSIELLPGFHRIIEAMPDSDTVHSFTLTTKIKEETAGGFFYVWYNVENYTCTVDKTAVVARKTDSISATNGIAFVALAENGTIDDATAGEHTELFAVWQESIAYRAGNIRRYNNNLYKCLQDHTSQSDWTPDVSPALWKNIADPTEEYPEWSQPIGAGDAYNTGDKVSHNNKHWESNVDNNVWEPGVYGWKEVK